MAGHVCLDICCYGNNCQRVVHYCCNVHVLAKEKVLRIKQTRSMKMSLHFFVCVFSNSLFISPNSFPPDLQLTLDSVTLLPAATLLAETSTQMSCFQCLVQILYCLSSFIFFTYSYVIKVYAS